MAELWREGDAFVTEYPNDNVRFEFSRIDAGKEVHALARVTSTLVTSLLYTSQRVNLTGGSARTSFVRYLKDREPNVDWAELIEQAFVAVLEAIREGEPIVRLSAVEDPGEMVYRVAKFLPELKITVLYGLGGSGKSTFAQMLGMACQGGWQLAGLDVLPCEVLICDWETDAGTVKLQTSMLANGFNIDTPDLHYRPCFAPLHEEGDSIGRYVSQNKIGLVIVDSLGWAVGGDKREQEPTVRMFEAMRRWRCTVLAVDHETPGKETGPFGSIYTTNAARNIWHATSSGEGAELHVALTQGKTNGPRQPAMGFRFGFDGGCTTVTSETPAPEVRGKLSHSLQITLCLKEAREYLTVEAVAEKTGLKESIVRTRLYDLERVKVATRIVINGGANKWGLAPKQDDEPEMMEA